MQITIIAGFGVGDIDTYEIAPAALEIVVDPEKGRAVNDILLSHSIMGNFRYTAEPILDRFRIAVGQYSDLDRIEEALAEIAALGYDEASYNAIDAYAIWDLVGHFQPAHGRGSGDEADEERGGGARDGGADGGRDLHRPAAPGCPRPLLPHQTYRLLHGYRNNRAAYAGLLEKCPAVSYIDATVTDGTIGAGETVRRREHYFSFDQEVYRAWSAQATVWLDEDPDNRDGGPHVCTFAPRLHQNSGKSANDDNGHNREDSGIGEICTGICTDLSSSLHHLPGTESMPAGASDPASRLCETCYGANMPDIPVDIRLIPEQTAGSGFSRCKTECKGVQTSVNVQTTVPVNPATRTLRCSNSVPSERRSLHPLPVERDEPGPASATGRPTSSIKRGGGGKYLCYDCLKKGKRPGKVQPLPGVLDHRTFERTKIELGRCDVCGTGKAVYRSREAQANLCEERLPRRGRSSSTVRCEGCYARLVREWNGRAGVR